MRWPIVVENVYQILILFRYFLYSYVGVCVTLCSLPFSKTRLTNHIVRTRVLWCTLSYEKIIMIYTSCLCIIILYVLFAFEIKDIATSSAQSANCVYSYGFFAWGYRLILTTFLHYLLVWIRLWFVLYFVVSRHHSTRRHSSNWFFVNHQLFRNYICINLLREYLIKK